MWRAKQKIKEIDHSACKELVIYERHFWDFKKEVDEKGILSGDIYNMDETGFCIKVGGSQWIIILKIHRQYYSSLSINCN